jgi:hypothetical protein
MTQDKNINYLNKEFGDFKNSLINYAKTYFPNTYNDFSPSSPGMMFIEMASYIGDVMSFYLDNQFQENLLIYAKEKENMMAMAYTLGYRPKASYASSTEVNIYQLLPASGSSGNLAPNYTYALVFPENTVLNSTVPNLTFLTTEEVDFSNTGSIELVLVDNTNFFLAKKTVKVISGEIKTTTFSFSAPEKFSNIVLSDSNILQVLNITGNDGSIWYEVPYLAQEVVYTKTSNPSANTDNVPYLLSLTKAPNRYATRLQSDGTLKIEFGAGVSSTADTSILPNPDNTQLGLIPSISGEENNYNKASVFFTKEYGVAPSNVTLTVKYIVGGGINSNVPVDSINSLASITNVNFKSTPTPSDIPTENTVRNLDNITVNNPFPSTGGRDGDTVNEIKLNTLNIFSAQNRTVTKNDYISRALSMPSIYGTIAKAYVTQDLLVSNNSGNDMLIDNNPLALSLYILGYDSNKNLITAPDILKNNLKNYLNQYRMVSDAVTIKNAYYINIGINFDITTLSGYNNNEVLQNCVNDLKDYFNIEKWSINQPIVISDIYSVLLKVKGVLSVVKLEFTNKQSSNGIYSLYGYDIAAATRNNVIYPSVDPAIFEIRYPNDDIKGRVVYI